MTKTICITNHSFNTGKLVPNSVLYDAVEFKITEKDTTVRIIRSYLNKKCKVKTIDKKLSLSVIFSNPQEAKIKFFLSDIDNIEKHYKPEFYDKNSIARYSQTEIAIDNKVYVFANDNCSDEWYLTSSRVLHKHFPLFDLANVKTEIVKKFLK